MTDFRRTISTFRSTKERLTFDGLIFNHIQRREKRVKVCNNAPSVQRSYFDFPYEMQQNISYTLMIFRACQKSRDLFRK